MPSGRMADWDRRSVKMLARSFESCHHDRECTGPSAT